MSHLSFQHRWTDFRLPILAAFAAVSVTLSAPVQAQEPDSRWKLVDEGLGHAGTTQPDGVRRYSFPRSDLEVQLDNVEIEPSLALGSWLAFRPMGEHVMVMGDLVLTHDEVNPVITQLLNGGIKITALHNHLLRSSPPTMYLHVEGHGDPWDLSVALGTAISQSATPIGTAPPSRQPNLDLDTATLDKIMGRQGSQSGAVFQYVIPRAETLTDAGVNIPDSMGTGTVLNFQPLGAGRAAVTGDFVLAASEVDEVMVALRAADIEITALHNHMLNDEPRLFFMHFWGTGDAATLARGLNSAVQKTAVR